MTRVALIGSVDRVGHVRSVLLDAPGIELAPTPDPSLGDVVVVAAETDDAVASARSIGRRVPVVLVIDEGDSLAGLRAALEAGARGCVAPDADAFSLRRTIAAAERFAASRATAEQPAGSSVVAVVGAAGGAGTTTIAVALARAVNALLIDLDLAGSDLAELLGLPPATVGLAGGGDPRCVLDDLVEGSSGLRLARVAPIIDLAWTVPTGACAALLREARRRENVIVVDAGRGVGPALEAIIEADTVVVVAPADRAERGRAGAEQFARLAPPDARIVLVECRARRGAALRRRVAAVSGRRAADIVVERLRAPNGIGQPRLIAALGPLVDHLAVSETAP